MTKKKYLLLIAAALRTELELFPESRAAVHRIALRLAPVLYETNTRFDRDRFLAACGVE